ncbi:MAG: type I glyceraldehyde-3-phosphate dehydrogenase [Myxococcota bacterium]|nr:type I glyceraldehyde-3-phosphate dehydrogenase [Myxococcota bacterium]
MSVRVAINGFGRIGRCVLRTAWNDPEIEFVHINDLTGDPLLAHLLSNDSVHGRFDVPVSAVEGGLQIGDKVVPTSAEPDPSKLPWSESSVDVVLECTGRFTARDKAQQHIDAGASKVIISAPASGADATICVGVNDETLDAEQHHVISNASCTTNCLSPVAKVLNDEFGIVRGLMTTVHSYTMDQNLLDAPHAKGDFRRARAAALNMVPTSTGAAKAVGLVLPELNGKLNGMAIRVPTANVSLVDLVVELEQGTSAEGINAALAQAANGKMRGVLEASCEPLVSGDLIGNPHSSIVDTQLTMMSGSNQAKLLSWYDNEWGFSNRLVDLVRILFGKERR